MTARKIIAVLCAAVIAAGMTGCGGKDSSSSAVQNSSSDEKSDPAAAESSAPDADSSSEAESDAAEDSGSAQNEQGELIKKAYDFVSGESWSMKVTFTDSEGNVTDIVRTVNGGDFYQLESSSIGSSGVIKVGEEAYDFNNVCGIYRKSSLNETANIISTVVEENLPQTATHITPDDSEAYDVEEYTYTGDTYITVLDFCFDKETGYPVKLTTTYSIEGQDDLVEKREYSELTTEIDESVFDLSCIDGLADFDSMTGEERQVYCGGVFGSAGVTNDELSAENISTETLKTISYDDFVGLVYKYGYDAE